MKSLLISFIEISQKDIMVPLIDQNSTYDGATVFCLQCFRIFKVTTDDHVNKHLSMTYHIDAEKVPATIENSNGWLKVVDINKKIECLVCDTTIIVAQSHILTKHFNSAQHTKILNIYKTMKDNGTVHNFTNPIDAAKFVNKHITIYNKLNALEDIDLECTEYGTPGEMPQYKFQCRCHICNETIDVIRGTENVSRHLNAHSTPTQADFNMDVCRTLMIRE